MSIGTHLSTAYAVCTLPLTYIGNKSPTLVGLTISKYKEQIVIYNNALSVHYTSIILQINSLVLSADDSRIKSFDFWALTQSANQALN